MDKLLDSRLERVEKALATLITSISTYNPAPALANDLVAADAELSEGFEQLSIHQSNYGRVLALRESSKALDNQIRETLTLLATTRQDLLAIPATSPPSTASGNPISYSELLSYARRISKFTLPPTYREPPAGDAEPNSQVQTNGTNTPIATNGEVHTSTVMDADGLAMAPGGQTQTRTSQHPGVSTNLSLWEQYLNQSADIPFVPWPTEEAIRKGALASIQILVDQGVDPVTFDPEKSAELEAERKRVTEAEDAIREQEREDTRRRELERRMSGGPAPERKEEPKVFQLETFDDDDSDG
ncbi:vitamin-D-receptor interacting mediator subunit 4-domain-containing protein [Cadophora sp. MPI-SDFR-AT-0126]|nr:vitamin-D-receptor interacting mediator subunit 4-domain-containing protein [Leotiomycetes sp. MPI-SDFR-AT-0126]